MSTLEIIAMLVLSPIWLPLLVVVCVACAAGVAVWAYVMLLVAREFKKGWA